MRSERRTLRCSKCPAALTLEVTQAAWCDDMPRAIGGVARFLKWDCDGDIRCPLHAHADGKDVTK